MPPAKSFLVRCSEAELEQIDRAAKEAGQSRNRFVVDSATAAGEALHQSTELLSTMKKIREAYRGDSPLIAGQDFPHG